MTVDKTHDEGEFTFVDAERAQLCAWVSLSASAKVDFFEEMIELAYRSGALRADRLALRDAPGLVAHPDKNALMKSAL
ncbi:MAG: hypothetical protein ABI206_09280 [Antricoccus sp.]